MPANSARTTQTYAGSGMSYVVPDDTDATVTGSNDTLTLGSGDTLAIEGAGTTVQGSSPAAVTLDPASGPTTFAGNGTIDIPASSGTSPFLTLTSGADYTIASEGAVAVFVHPGVSAVVAAPQVGFSAVGEGSNGIYVDQLTPASSAGSNDPVSARIDDYATPQQGAAVQVQTFSASGAQLSDTLTFTDGSSEEIEPGNGAFGIYLVRHFASAGPVAPGFGPTLYDIVDGRSILHVAGPAGIVLGDGQGAASTFDATTVSAENVTYSGLDMTGPIASAEFDDANATSLLLSPSSGAFGIFRTANWFADAGPSGAAAGTTYDVGNGTSLSIFTTDGAYGLYRATATTTGFEATGAFRKVTLDDVNGSSITFTPVPGDGQYETETTTAGQDGSGAVLSTDLVQAGTGASLFHALTGFTLDADATGIPLDLDAVGVPFPTHANVGPAPLPPAASGTLPAVSLADFAATSPAAVVAPTSKTAFAFNSEPVPTSASPMPFVVPNATATLLPTRHA